MARSVAAPPALSCTGAKSATMRCAADAVSSTFLRASTCAAIAAAVPMTFNRAAAASMATTSSATATPACASAAAAAPLMTAFVAIAHVGIAIGIGAKAMAALAAAAISAVTITCCGAEGTRASTGSTARSVKLRTWRLWRGKTTAAAGHSCFAGSAVALCSLQPMLYDGSCVAAFASTTAAPATKMRTSRASLAKEPGRTQDDVHGSHAHAHHRVTCTFSHGLCRVSTRVRRASPAGAPRLPGWRRCADKA